MKKLKIFENESSDKKPHAGGKIEIEGDEYEVVAYFDNIEDAKKYEASKNYTSSDVYKDNQGYSATDDVESDHYCYTKTEDGGIAFTDLAEVTWSVK